MTKKENKKANRIVRDMKECFRSFNLPVSKIEGIQDNPMDVVFTSQIYNEHVSAVVAVSYERQLGYVGIGISLQARVPTEKFGEILRLLNLLNGMMPLYHYSVCTCCNGVSIEGGLFLSGDSLPMDKFKRLVHDLLEDSYLCFPLVTAVARGGDPEALYDQFMQDHQDALKKERTSPIGAEREILNDAETVLKGMQIQIEEENRADGCFMNFQCPEGTDFTLRMGITVDSSAEMVIFHLAPSFTVPEEKISVMTELVGRLNKMTRLTHLFIQRETKRVTFLKGIMILNGALDKKEFEIAVRMTLAGGFMLFPIIREQLSSNEGPEALLARIKETGKEQH